MQVDKELIKSKIDVIEINLEFLKEYRDIDKKDFINNYKDIQAVKYSLFEIIECCIDIASYIISCMGFERAESYAEMFEILGKNKITNSTLTKRLSDMARFRNLLVHSYAKVDNLKILEFVKKESNDIKIFVKEILEFLAHQAE